MRALAACAGGVVDRRDGDGAVVLDVDLGAGFLGDRLDDRAALADHFADLVRMDLHRQQARRVLATSRHAARDSALAISPRMCRRPCLACASAIFMISSVMPSILMSICSAEMPFCGTGHLEVHVAEVVFVTEDVGQHDEVVAFLDQAHRDAGDRRLDRHAGVHQRQRGTADRGHRGGTVRFGDLRDARGWCTGTLPWSASRPARRAWRGGRGRFRDASGPSCGRLHRPSTAGSCNGTGSVPCTRRTTASMIWPSRAVPRVSDDQRLGFAAGEQRRAVGARQHADAATLIGRTVSRSRPSMRILVLEHRIAHGLVFQLAEFLAPCRPCSSHWLRHAACQALQHVLLDSPRWRRGAPACRAPRRPAFKRLPTAAFRAAISASFLAGACQFHLVTPTSATSSLMALMTVCICWWPNITAPSITSSDSIAASDSTISTALAVPATTSSSSRDRPARWRSGSAGTGR